MILKCSEIANDKIAVELYWSVAEQFNNYLNRRAKFGSFNIKCGGDFYTRIVECKRKDGEEWVKWYRTGNKFCPFCGGVPRIIRSTSCGGHGEFYETAKVACKECGASTSSVIIDGFYGATTTEQDTIDAWNSRVEE